MNAILSYDGVLFAAICITMCVLNIAPIQNQKCMNQVPIVMSTRSLLIPLFVHLLTWRAFSWYSVCTMCTHPPHHTLCYSTRCMNVTWANSCNRKQKLLQVNHYQIQRSAHNDPLTVANHWHHANQPTACKRAKYRTTMWVCMWKCHGQILEHTLTCVKPQIRLISGDVFWYNRKHLASLWEAALVSKILSHQSCYVKLAEGSLDRISSVSLTINSKMLNACFIWVRKLKTFLKEIIPLK